MTNSKKSSTCNQGLQRNFVRQSLRGFVIVLFLFPAYFFHASSAKASDRAAKSFAPVYGVKVIASFAHDREAFTQGFLYEKGMLYEGTGQYGHSSLRRMTLDGGNFEIRKLPKIFFGEGVTVFENRVIQLTWKARVGLIWDKDSLVLIGTFTYPTEGWGLTHDGRFLIMSDGSANLTFLDPTTFQAQRRVSVTDAHGPVTRLNELEYIKGEIWANVWMDSRIARINPENGKVTGWIDLSELVATTAPDSVDSVLNGIAYDQDNDRIFVTGKRWPKIFEIEIVEEGEDAPPLGSRLPGKENR